MKKWKQLTVTLALLLGFGGAALVPAQNAAAINVFDQCKNNADAAVCKAKGDTVGPLIQTVINILLYILGAVAVVMIVIGGIRYTTSNGDSSAIKSAKDTILYSVIGLIVAILSYTIVNFVVSWF
ncbi:MAG TPA: pilin [Candidatus Saccharimonadales bacterium]|nr:pilin [Candidatus Saccharimonadales bacterium]